MRISFDFDGTLGYSKAVQEYAKKLVEQGYNVWIVTRRYDSLERYDEAFKLKYKIENLEAEHKYLFEIAEYCGIPKDRIKFMNMEDKFLFFKDSDFLWHLDDDSLEIKDINKYTKTKAINCKSGNWKHKCERMLSEIN
jgi:hydroxymethylpyrimidine pyrophosphatase-like HAD family hydrolase